MRRTIGGGTLNAHPLGVPVRSTSPGAMLANVDNSEIVSAGLKTRFAVVSLCRRAPLTERLQIKIVEQRELLRVKDREPRSDRTKAAILLPLKNCVCGICTSRALMSLAIVAAQT